MKKLLLIIALVATAVGSAFAQIKLGDNPGVLDPKALLELESTTKGLLLPRMNTAQQITITAPDGMMIYNTDSACICVRGGGVWRSLCSDGGGRPWGTFGNANTNPINNFIGTSDGQPLVFRTNNAEVMRMLTDGKIGIGTAAPDNKLHVVATSNPLRLEGLQLQTGVITDEVLTVLPGTGVVRKVSLADIGANSITVGNGLTKVGNLITFGGGLTTPTIINTSVTNTLTLGGLQTGTVTTGDSLLITGTNGLLQRVGINQLLSGVTPDFWLDGTGIKPDGALDNTERVYRMGQVGIGLTTTPTSTFQVEGSVSKSIVTTTAATFTVTDAHHTIIADCRTAAVALTLPTAAAANRGRIYYITKSDETTNLLSFTPALKLTETTDVASYNYTKRLTIQSDGANWRVISE